MFKKALFAMVVLTVTIGLAAADEFSAVIKKVDGDKVTFYTVKKKEKSEDKTLTATKDVTVASGKFDKDTKKYSAGDKIDGGLKASVFKDIGDKGLTVRITTDADNKNITQILVTKKGK